MRQGDIYARAPSEGCEGARGEQACARERAIVHAKCLGGQSSVCSALQIIQGTVRRAGSTRHGMPCYGVARANLERKVLGEHDEADRAIYVHHHKRQERRLPPCPAPTTLSPSELDTASETRGALGWGCKEACSNARKARLDAHKHAGRAASSAHVSKQHRTSVARARWPSEGPLAQELLGVGQGRPGGGSARWRTRLWSRWSRMG